MENNEINQFIMKNCHDFLCNIIKKKTSTILLSICSVKFPNDMHKYA